MVVRYTPKRSNPRLLQRVAVPSTVLSAPWVRLEACGRWPNARSCNTLLGKERGRDDPGRSGEGVIFVTRSIPR